MFKITRQWTKDNAERVEIGSALGTIVVYLRPLTGGDMRAIADASAYTKDGKVYFSGGTTQMERVVRAVVYVEGIADENGSPVDRITKETYETLPAWILTPIAEAIERMNSLPEKAAGE